MTDVEERIIALEEEVAHLQLKNDELSSEMLERWKIIEQLQKKLGHLEERFTNIEDGGQIDEANVKPPHW